MKYAISVCLILFAYSGIANSQTCAPPPIAYNSKAENLFSPEQETILGDLVLQQNYTDLRFITDPKLMGYIEGVAASLIEHLPPTGLQFRFHIVDMPEANAFNIPGGHVFLSRKLVGFLKSEDELAAVIAHELGHAAVHHTATDFSSRLRKVLNITSLGGAKDITEKYNLLIENARTKKATTRAGHENDQQLEADRIGLFALTAAGYDPAAAFTFFDRLVEGQGKTGSWFDDLFGKSNPNQKRLREIAKITEQLPAACREGRGSREASGFLKWQADVLFFRESERSEALPGLIWRRDLGQKLRSDVSRIAVSPNGRYIAAIDDFSLTVIEREPLKLMFQFPVEDVDQVLFTSDEKFVEFITHGLRFEKWSIADQRPVEIRELVLRKDCVENKLSPDGNYLACIDTSLAANLIYVPTGERIYQKKEFYRLNINEYWRWVYADYDTWVRKPFFRIEFTPDSKTVVFSRSNHYRADPKYLSMGSRYITYDTTLAVDTSKRKPVDVGGEIDKVASRSYAFIEPKRIIGMESADANESGIFSFPDGKRLAKFALYANEIQPSGDPNYVVIRPLRNTTMGVFDISNGQIAIGLNKADAAVWRNQFIFESAAGKLVVREMAGNGKDTQIDKELATLDLPAAAIGDLRAAEVSNNFDWLVLSSKTRGGLWNISKGERKLHVTGFRGGIVADDGGAVAEFPKSETDSHALVLMNPSTLGVNVIRNLPDSGVKQFGKFVLTRTSLEPKPAEEKKDSKEIASSRPSFNDSDVNLRENVRYELKDFIRDKVIWSKDFPKDAPSFAFDEFSGRLFLYWYLGLESGKAKLRENPELKAKAEALGNKDSDYLIEVIDAFAGKQLGSLLLETGKGSFYVGGGISEGDWLVLFDSEDRVLVYSISTGTLKQRFFGRNAAISPIRNQLVVENMPGEVSLFDLETGDRQGIVQIKGRTAFVRFNFNGTKLFVLNDQQTAYAFDVVAMMRKKQ